ncbi:hypothetical protein OH76DRAFT_175974 [Lentinus brumalis]|uniref:DUF6818 domain-containing protein n=1 Tax=Lentinus brumalis TaxID=2498619 RepID=A0A371CNP9_9APHY|nr:hypothetical protein OH76DRAFT_175974 [Polyporus brumalis]
MPPGSDGEARRDDSYNYGIQSSGTGHKISGGNSYSLVDVKDWSGSYPGGSDYSTTNWTFPDPVSFPQTDPLSMPPMGPAGTPPAGSPSTDQFTIPPIESDMSNMDSEDDEELASTAPSGYHTRAAARRDASRGSEPSPTEPAIPKATRSRAAPSDAKVEPKRKRAPKPEPAESEDAAQPQATVNSSRSTRTKKTGSRSGKAAHQPAVSSQPDPAVFDDASTDPAKRRGRQLGATNFSFADVGEVLRLVHAHRPIGPNGWNRVTAGYNAYAARCNRPRRDIMSLRTKYYKLVNSKKPTGNPHCPPHVQEAKNIEREIQSAVFMGTVKDDPAPPDWDRIPRNASESDLEVDSTSGFVDDEGADSGDEGGGDADSDAEQPPVKHPKVDGASQAGSKSLTQPAVRQRHRQRAGDLLSALGNHLDPEVREQRETAREEQRNQRMGTLIDVLNQRDIRAENRELRQQVDRLTHELMDARMMNMRLENELRMSQLMTGFYAPSPFIPSPQQYDAGSYGNTGYADDVSGSYIVPQFL